MFDEPIGNQLQASQGSDIWSRYLSASSKIAEEIEHKTIDLVERIGCDQVVSESAREWMRVSDRESEWGKEGGRGRDREWVLVSLV